MKIKSISLNGTRTHENRNTKIFRSGFSSNEYYIICFQDYLTFSWNMLRWILIPYHFTGMPPTIIKMINWVSNFVTIFDSTKKKVQRNKGTFYKLDGQNCMLVCMHSMYIRMVFECQTWTPFLNQKNFKRVCLLIHDPISPAPIKTAICFPLVA